MDKQTELQNILFSLSDEKYRNFHSRLMPTVDKTLVIGIRTPVLRNFAKEFCETDKATSFLKELPHKYYEENNLHAFIIEKIESYDELIKELNIFLPCVDNWATCDMLKPKILKNHKDKLICEIDRWLKSEDTYTVRYGINCLMAYYLDEDFKEEYFDRVVSVKSEEYYINMMRAWYFATALSKRYEETLSVLENRKLDKWTHNKVIQKAMESYRITSEQKEYLKALKY